MIFQTDYGKIDSNSDLTPEERHVVQKLLCWRTIVDSLEEFQEKTEQALQKGWNDSGPVRKSKNLKYIIHQLEEEIQGQLKDNRS